MLSEEDDLLHAWYPLRTSTDARAFSPRNPRKNKNRRRRSTGFRLANSRARFRLLESRADAYRAARAEADALNRVPDAMTVLPPGGGACIALRIEASTA